MKEQSVYEMVTARIITLLEQGTVPWHKPWKSSSEAPRNLITNRPYKGINCFLLHSMQYSCPYWVTYRQAQQLGGNVKKGEKACPVIFWKWIEVENKETGNKDKVPLLRYYSVFNADAQCTGLEIPSLAAPVQEITPIEAAQKIVEAMPKRPEIREDLLYAYYSPVMDFVAIPPIEQFETAEDYWATLFHELCHSTGHESRLNRTDISEAKVHWSPFGSEEYQREELVAEMGSAFLCAESGILERTVEDSAAYIASWLKCLKNDSRLVIIAAAQGQRAAEYICGNLKPELQSEVIAA